jgi:transcription antitermination factor NusG
LSTLNRLRFSLARYDKAAQGQKVKFRSGRFADFRTVIVIDTMHKINALGVTKIIAAI